MSRYTDDVVQQKNVSINYQYETEKFVSLEKALAPISADTNNLTQHIQIAKTRCCYPSKHGLTRDEAAAIYLYTMEWGEYSLYRMLNRTLRFEKSNEIKKWFLFFKII